MRRSKPLEKVPQYAICQYSQPSDMLEDRVFMVGKVLKKLLKVVSKPPEEMPFEGNPYLGDESRRCCMVIAGVRVAFSVGPEQPASV